LNILNRYAVKTTSCSDYRGCPAFKNLQLRRLLLLPLLPLLLLLLLLLPEAAAAAAAAAKRAVMY
jgi:hypothetical protein